MDGEWRTRWIDGWMRDEGDASVHLDRSVGRLCVHRRSRRQCQVESELTRDEDRDSRSKAIRESGRSSIARDDRKSISGDGGPARWSGDDAEEETVIASVIIIIPKGDDGDSGDDDEADESEEEEQVEKGGGSVAMGDTPWEEEEESEEKSSGRG
jgi:hypothetical protein